jgi:capsular polysaccharide biosynthesis protein
MTADNEPGFDRYKVALRRLWPILAAGAVVGAMIGAFTIGSTFESTAQILVVTNDAPIATATFPLEGVTRAVPLRAIIAQAKQDDVEDVVSDASGAVVTLILAPDDSTSSISATIQSSSEAATSKAVKSVVDQLQAAHSKLVKDAAAPVLSALAEQEKATDARLSDLDAKMAALSSDQQSLATAYAVARVPLAEIANNLALRTSAVNEYVAAASNAVRLGDHTSPSSSDALRAVAAGLGGLLLAGVGIVIFTVIDRSVRSPADLAGLHVPVLGVLARSTDNRGIGALSGALAHAPDTTSDRTVGLVPAGSDALAPPVAQALLERVATYGDTRLELHPAFSLDPESALHARNHAYVLLGRWGRTKADELRSTEGALSAGGCDVVGVVLFDVPSRNLHGWFD